jgi:hypothetical protein
MKKQFTQISSYNELINGQDHLLILENSPQLLSAQEIEKTSVEIQPVIYFEEQYAFGKENNSTEFEFQQMFDFRNIVNNTMNTTKIVNNIWMKFIMTEKHILHARYGFSDIFAYIGGMGASCGFILTNFIGFKMLIYFRDLIHII